VRENKSSLWLEKELCTTFSIIEVTQIFYEFNGVVKDKIVLDLS
jgi:hypothetical protein